MSWPWNNPTRYQAEEAYDYYRNKYYNAANQKRASERQEQSYVTEKRTAVTNMATLTARKLNLEKRLEEVERIIKMMTGSGGFFGVNIPEVISKAKKSLTQADASFRSSIRLEGGGVAASLETAFETKTVEGEALQAFQAEKARIEQEIIDLKNQIAHLAELISSLTKKINACNQTQAALSASMSGYAYDMNHYKTKANQ